MEKFFTISSSLDLIDTQELLLKKYDINYIFKLDFLEGFELITKAYEKELESKLWDRWLIEYKYMSKDNFITFEDYVDKMLGRDKDTTSKEDLLKMASEIEKKISSKRGDKFGN